MNGIGVKFITLTPLRTVQTLNNLTFYRLITWSMNNFGQLFLIDKKQAYAEFKRNK